MSIHWRRRSYAAPREGIQLASTEQFESITGQGVTGIIAGRKVALGNLKLLQSLSIDPGDLSAQADAGRKEGHTVMYVAIDGEAAGLIGVADPIKASRHRRSRICAKRV